MKKSQDSSPISPSPARAYLGQCVAWLNRIERGSNAQQSWGSWGMVPPDEHEDGIGEESPPFPASPGLISPLPRIKGGVAPLNDAWQQEDATFSEDVAQFLSRLLGSYSVGFAKAAAQLEEMEKTLGKSMFHALNTMLMGIPEKGLNSHDSMDSMQLERLVSWESERKNDRHYSYGFAEALWTRIHPVCLRDLQRKTSLLTARFQSPSSLVSLSHMPVRDDDHALMAFRNRIAQILVTQGVNLDARIDTRKGAQSLRQFWGDVPGTPWPCEDTTRHVSRVGNLLDDERQERLAVRQALAEPVAKVTPVVPPKPSVRAGSWASCRLSPTSSRERHQNAWDAMLIRYWRTEGMLPNLRNAAFAHGIVLEGLVRVPPNLGFDRKPVRAAVSERLEPLSERLWACRDDGDFMEVYLWLKKNPQLDNFKTAEARAHFSERVKIKREARLDLQKTDTELRVGDAVWESHKKSNWSTVK